MSLIQDALERAHTKEPEAPQQPHPVAEEPRMQTNKFYETLDPVIEAEKPSFFEKNPRSFKLSANQRIGVIIGGLVLFSLLLSRLFAPAYKTSVTDPPVETRSVVVQTKTVVTQKPASHMKFTLTGITAADGAPLALINNQVVGVGDRLREGAIVKAITTGSAVLEWQNQRITLTL